MKNNKKTSLSAIAVAMIAVTSTATSAAPQVEIKKVGKSAVAKSSELSFADWYTEQKLKRTDYTDRLIVTFNDKKQGKAVPPGLSLIHI